jgi:urea transport system permease protein
MAIRDRWAAVLLWGAVLAAGLAAPSFLSGYALSLLGRFLALGLVTVGVVWTWGYGGILSLGQGVFFGLGGYALAMHLKLESLGSDPLPDFMVWNGLAHLPWWWAPFRSPGFALAMVVVLPGVAAALLGVLLFRRRVSGVYVSLITQALALAFSLLLISQQGLTGGFNGLTNFSTLFGLPLASSAAQRTLYWVTVLCLAGALAGSHRLLTTGVGRLLVAIRDSENRIRFLGYDPVPSKVFAFTLGAVLAGIGGALFTLHVGVISPAMVGVVPSIEMVIWAAAGGRDRLLGAVAATVAGNLVKDWVSSAVPELWLYVMGGLFVAVATVRWPSVREIALRWPGHVPRAVLGEEAADA